MSAVSHPLQAETGRLFEQQPIEGRGDLCNIDRLAPRARSAAVRQNARPSGRGQGELYENVCFPYRARKPAKRTPALQGGEASQSKPLLLSHLLIDAGPDVPEPMADAGQSL